MDFSEVDFSHDLTKMIRPCQRCGTGMKWKGEALVCPECHLVVMTNRAVAMFGLLLVGAIFVLPAHPEILWEKTSLELDGEWNAENLQGGRASFGFNDMVIPAQFRQISGIFSYN